MSGSWRAGIIAARLAPVKSRPDQSAFTRQLHADSIGEPALHKHPSASGPRTPKERLFSVEQGWGRRGFVQSPASRGGSAPYLNWRAENSAFSRKIDPTLPIL